MPSPANETVKPLDLGGFQLQVSSPEIWRLNFERHDEFEGGTDAKFRLDLLVYRPAEDRVLVELVAESDEASTATFNVSYRTTLTVQPEPGKAGELDYDEVLKNIASQIGPVVVYPYIRETISSVSAKSGLKPIVLPVMNVGAMFDPASLVLPPVPDTEGEQKDQSTDSG